MVGPWQWGGRVAGAASRPPQWAGGRPCVPSVVAQHIFLQQYLTPRCAATWPAGIEGEASLPLLPTVVGPKVKGSLAGEATLESEGRQRE